MTYTNMAERLVAARNRPGARLLAKYGLALLGLEVPSQVPIGEGLQLPHGAVGLVVTEHAVIGSRVRLYGGVTLGRSDTYLYHDAGGGRVSVGDDVIVGTGAKVLFRRGQNLLLGEGSVVGANAVVTESVPAYEVWAGVPARKVGDRPRA